MSLTKGCLSLFLWNTNTVFVIKRRTNKDVLLCFISSSVALHHFQDVENLDEMVCKISDKYIQESFLTVCLMMMF